MELAKLADGLGMKQGERGKNSGSIGDFAFHDSDPEKDSLRQVYV
jgi:hypothetical protein